MIFHVGLFSNSLSGVTPPSPPRQSYEGLALLKSMNATKHQLVQTRPRLVPKFTTNLDLSYLRVSANLELQCDHLPPKRIEVSSKLCPGMIPSKSRSDWTVVVVQVVAHRTTDQVVPGWNPTGSWAVFSSLFYQKCVLNQVRRGAASLRIFLNKLLYSLWRNKLNTLSLSQKSPDHNLTYSSTNLILACFFSVLTSSFLDTIQALISMLK